MKKEYATPKNSYTEKNGFKNYSRSGATSKIRNELKQRMVGIIPPQSALVEPYNIAKRKVKNDFYIPSIQNEPQKPLIPDMITSQSENQGFESFTKEFKKSYNNYLNGAGQDSVKQYLQTGNNPN